MEAALRSLIDWYTRAGVDIPPIAPAKVAPKRTVKAVPQTRPNTPPVSRAAPIKTAGPQIDISALIESASQAARKAHDLSELRAAMDSFDAGRLSDNARGPVFARGNPNASLMVVGEAPSPEDDIKSSPLSGRSGALLSQMLGAIGLGEDDYYLTLSVNWRLPQNRTPKPAEIDICRPFLRRHIELAAPSHILMLGSTPMQALTEAGSIMKLHGQWQAAKWQSAKSEQIDIPALPIYHPELLLKQADLKKDAWRDLLTLRAAFDGQIST